MNVRIRLFAILRERAGSDSIEIELAHGATVADALRVLEATGPLAGMLERLPVHMAVNREYATPQTPLAAEDELALIPPLSGGSPDADPQIHVRVTEEELSVEALSRTVSRAGAGAIVIFCGVTREVDHLDYEAYREMAHEKITLVASECVQRQGLAAAAIEHRIGKVGLGEPSVIVAVSAAHRDEAFAGAREAIDAIKAKAPIWKREVSRDGTGRWVDGTEPRSLPDRADNAAPLPGRIVQDLHGQ